MPLIGVELAPEFFANGFDIHDHGDHVRFVAWAYDEDHSVRPAVLNIVLTATARDRFIRKLLGVPTITS